jgi:hypothetical protein
VVGVWEMVATVPTIPIVGTNREIAQRRYSPARLRFFSSPT